MLSRTSSLNIGRGQHTETRCELYISEQDLNAMNILMNRNRKVCRKFTLAPQIKSNANLLTLLPSGGGHRAHNWP